MSLVIASVRPADIVISADSRCTVTENGVIKRVDDHFQKIFPIRDHPVVIAHMGENRLNELPLSEFIGRFVGQLNTGNYTIREIADELERYARASVRERLRGFGAKSGCNLWVAGFSVHEPGPQLIELFWQWRESVFVTEEREFNPIAVVSGGDGKALAPEVDWKSVDGKSVQETCDYQRSLIRKAIDADVKNNTVGGAIHEVLITSSDWHWTLPPFE